MRRWLIVVLGIFILGACSEDDPGSKDDFDAGAQDPADTGAQQADTSDVASDASTPDDDDSGTDVEDTGSDDDDVGAQDAGADDAGGDDDVGVEDAGDADSGGGSDSCEERTLPSDWMRLTTGPETCRYGDAMSGSYGQWMPEADCRYLEGVYPFTWAEQSGNQRVMGIQPNLNEGR